MHLQESGEMYLETILILSKEKPSVRAVDIGEYMHFSKPSVSRAVGLLKNGGFHTVDVYTPHGIDRAFDCFGGTARNCGGGCV